MEPQLILETVNPRKSFLVETTETKFVFHLVGAAFYVRKLASKDPRYCLVTQLNQKKKYTEQDLDVGAEVEYMHPRLGRTVQGGAVTSIALR